MLGVLWLCVCHYDAWFVKVWGSRRKSDENVAFDSSGEDAEQGVVDVFAD